jgi:glycogen operon protein
MRTLPGHSYPLGATWDGAGVNFAIYSEHATGVELCLFDANGDETRIPLRHRTAFVWHAYLPAIAPGQLYGYRVQGPYDPERGLRFNTNNLLLDPYAKSVHEIESWDDGLFAYELGHPDGDLKRNEQDARGVPLGVVIDPSFDWEGDEPPNVPFHKSVVYETHVRGLTMRHPEVPPPIRGKYAGVSCPPITEHLRRLGITAVELLPVHCFVDDKTLVDRGLRNYWGYNTINFFAPDVRYRASESPGDGVRELKEMVKALHRAGFEVILDVVYNHTAEGNHLGPTLSFKGIDNPTYYRLVPDNARYYFDYTGTGNSLNVRHPQTLALIMDSLRYWVVDMHVDGFRFDLAATLARSLHDVDQLSSFFTIIHQDPILSHVKLIAEPWDLGEGGYQVGNFPVRWAEWNGKYRDAIRAFWRGQGGVAGELAYRVSGSSDLYRENGRAPFSSINFVTAHDGFTLADLVAHNEKHNEANGEENKDGANDNQSWNCGAEGESREPGVNRLRTRQRKNFLATLLLSQGTPMISGGDEIGRSQRGNNNAYCQDNETSFYDWELDAERKALLDFTARLLRLRREHPSLRRSKFFRGRRIRGLGVRDIMWLRHDGREMTDEDWRNPHTSSLGMFLAGKGIDEVDEEGNAEVDDDLFLVMNASDATLTYKLPVAPRGATWELTVTTADEGERELRAPSESTTLGARELKLFVLRREPSRQPCSARPSPRIESSCTRKAASRGRTRSSITSMRSACRTRTSRRTPRASRGARTATTRSIRRASIRASAPSGSSSDGSIRCACEAWGTSSTSCRITWGSASETTRGGTTCSRTVSARSSPIASTSSGGRRRKRSAGACSCRRSGRSTAKRSSAARSSSRATADRSSRATSSIASRSRRARSRRCSSARRRGSARAPAMRRWRSSRASRRQRATCRDRASGRARSAKSARERRRSSSVGSKISRPRRRRSRRRSTRRSAR